MDNIKFTLIQEWNELLKSGIITQEEFNKKKAELLGTPLQKTEIETPKIEPVKKEEVSSTTFIQPKVPEPKAEEKALISENISNNLNNNKAPWLMIAVASLLLIITAGTLSYFFYFKEKWIDDAAPRYYVSSSSVSLRSSKVAGVDNNYVGSIPYGAELITYDNQADWSEVKYNEKKGYVSSKYILNKADFDLLNNIFGDNISRDAIESNKCRLALLDFVKRITTDSIQRMNWKIFTRAKDVKPNTIFYPKHLVNTISRFSDFAFIVKNIATNEYRLGFYSFTDDESIQYITSINIPQDGNIINITKHPFNKNNFIVYLDNGLSFTDYIFNEEECGA